MRVHTANTDSVFSEFCIALDVISQSLYSFPTLFQPVNKQRSYSHAFSSTIFGVSNLSRPGVSNETITAVVAEPPQCNLSRTVNDNARLPTKVT